MNRQTLFYLIVAAVAYVVLIRGGGATARSTPVDPTTGLPITVGSDYGANLGALRQWSVQTGGGGFI